MGDFMNKVKVVLFYWAPVKDLEGDMNFGDKVTDIIIQGLIKDKPHRTLLVMFGKKDHRPVKGDIAG
jgi:hypothetical protein